jgi:phage tail sheath protein FI
VSSSLGANITFQAETSSVVLNFSGSTFGAYSHASTPWIQSQTIGGTKLDLFKVHTLSDGTSANKEVKVSFINMKPSDNVDYDYGTFTMLVRRYDDTDTKLEILEQYDNLTLDPSSPEYIARVIGNSAPTEDQVTGEMYYQGDFPNRSQYVWVEMNDIPLPETALPFGFQPVLSTVNVASSLLVSPSYVTTRWYDGSTGGYTTQSVDKKLYYGWEFDTNNEVNSAYLNAIPSGSPQVGTAFNLEGVTDVPNGSTAKAISLTDTDSLAYRKFTVPFQGGFDGLNPARDINLGEDILSTNSQGFDLSTSVAGGSKSYKKALNAISNPDQYDFNLLVLPGVIYELHSYVANEALSLCEDRGDAFYIMDTVKLNATIATATGKAAEIDSNYAATYYPWLRVIDTNSNKLLWVPPSVILPEIFAYNDNVAAEWFAPAGLNRGGIASAVGVKVRLPQTSRDTLYEAKVNPIAQFPGQGICVWGQKTLQRRSSALDRVNVRRLLIALKKFIASSSRYLVFEQNVEATRNRFLNIVNPYLASVQERSGLYAFRVIMDETNNTPDVIDRNILYGQIYLQPTKTAEFIVLDFNVLPTGAVFPTA